MKWLTDSISRFFSQHAKISVLIIVALAITLYLVLHFTSGSIIAISIIALIIASIAAISNLLSLKWSRDVIRPFLCVPSENINIYNRKHYKKISLKILNSGSLPATEVKVDLDFFGNDEVVNENNNSKIYPLATESPDITPMILPNNYYIVDYIIDLNDEKDAQLWNDISRAKTKLRIKIIYISLRRKHITIQTEKISLPEWESRLVRIPVSPQKWE